jgi:hypothetical protein
LNNVSNFFRMSAADGAGEHSAILRKNVSRSAVNFSAAGDHTVGGQSFFRHAEIGALRLGEHELFDKAARIEKLLDALPGRELAVRALFCRDFWITLSGAPL